MTATERPAQPGQYCTCGRQAVTVFITEDFGETGWCGISDGGAQAGPCPFCGGARHEGRCPNYQLRPGPPDRPESPASPEPRGSNVTYLHRDDTPHTLRLLDGLLGHRSDRAELGYQPDQWGAEVDWDRLAGGALSITEVAVVHIALGCAIAERHGGPLSPAVRGPLRALLRDLAPGDGRPGAGRGHRPRTNVASRRAVTTDDDVTPLPPGIDL